jgi:hypothetical protein
VLQPELPLDLVARMERLEAVLGARLHFRLVHMPDPGLRGRVVEKRGVVEIECNDVNPGFFWHLDVLRELLTRLEGGEAAPITLMDE